MRDPKRIARICKLLQKVWIVEPDQRLGQFLQNYVFGRGDIFYNDDDETEVILKELLRLNKVVTKKGGKS